MTKTSARLPIRRTEFGELLMWYDLEDYLFHDVHEQFERGECICEFDFYCIVDWKSRRNKPEIKKGLGQLGMKPWHLLRRVEAADGLEDKLKVLTEVNGSGIAIASAILAVCCPEKYTVVDTYILRMLDMLASDEYISDDAKGVKLYIEYNEKCKRWSRKLGISLKRTDKLLWTKAWKERVVP